MDRLLRGLLVLMLALPGTLAALPARAASEALLSADELDDLLGRLAAEQDETEAAILEGLVMAAWSRSPSPTASLLYDRAGEALADEDAELSLELMDRVVDLDPKFAQGWYQWATLHYLMDDYETAITGLERAIELEPRHFAALAAIGVIFEAYGNDRAAYAAVQRAYAINPHLKDGKTWLRRLERSALGERI